jgi:hypothetical protein
MQSLIFQFRRLKASAASPDCARYSSGKTDTPLTAHSETFDSLVQQRSSRKCGAFPNNLNELAGGKIKATAETKRRDEHSSQKLGTLATNMGQTAILIQRAGRTLHLNKSAEQFHDARSIERGHFCDCCVQF